MLPHRYQISGRHNYRFVLLWDVNDVTKTKEIYGNTTVYDINENPLVVLSLRKNEKEEALHPPCKHEILWICKL